MGGQWEREREIEILRLYKERASNINWCIYIYHPLN